MKALLAVLVLAALASAAHGAIDADVAGHGTPWPGTHRDALEEVGYFPLPDPYSVGLGWDGTYIWIAAGDQAAPPCKFYLFDEYGNQVDVGPQGGGASGWGHRDLTTCDGKMFGSFSTLVGGHTYAGSGIFVYEGYFIGAMIYPNRAMACDYTDFYTGGFDTDLYRLQWDHVWGSSAVVTDLGGPYPGTFGLAHAWWDNSLWCTTAAGTGEIYQFDLWGHVQNVYVDPSHPNFGGCEILQNAERVWVLAAVVQETPDGVVLYYLASGGSPVEPASWGRIKALF